MNLIIIITYLFGCFSFLHSLDFGCRAIFVCPTHVEYIRALKLLESRVDISGEHTTDDIPEMRDVVNVGKC